MDWIKLETEKPTIGQTVFSWGKQGMRICIYTNEIGFFGKPKKEAKFSNLMSKWRIIDEDVTHWMPLPKPPTE